MSRAQKAIEALKEELQMVIASKQALEQKIESIKSHLKIIESLAEQEPIKNNEDLLKFKD